MTQNERRVLLVASHHVWMQTRLIQGIIDYATLHTRWKIEFVGQHAEDWFLKAAGNCDGILGLNFLSETANLLRRVKLPIVNVVGATPVEWPSVSPDDVEIGRMAGEHLVAQQYPHVAYCGIPLYWSEDRQAGFTAVARSAGIVPHILQCQKPSDYWDEQAAAPVLQKWLAVLPKPVGIFCCNDDMAGWVLRQAQALKLRVPADVAVVGVDNNDIRCLLGPIPLSSIDPDHHRMAYEAARLLNLLMEKKPIREHRMIVPPARVIARASTGWASTGHLSVDQAISFVQRSAGVATVDQVCHHVDVPRRTLERLFRERLQTSIAAEISKVRFENARRLVLDTSLPLVDIAEKLEFGCVSSMIHGYRRRFGVPPARDRQSHRELDLSGKREPGKRQSA